jgi:hypothetical protein
MLVAAAADDHHFASIIHVQARGCPHGHSIRQKNVFVCQRTWMVCSSSSISSSSSSSSHHVDHFEQVPGHFAIWPSEPSLPVDRVSLGCRSRSACANAATIPRINEIKVKKRRGISSAQPVRRPLFFKRLETFPYFFSPFRRQRRTRENDDELMT